ncbi:MAG: XRE family transcriptional regulator [Candidatus Muiribacteriota bacterium]|jgi:transcriptional regulator with XRE-family HTH domain
MRERFKELRKKLNISQKILAEKLGIPVTAVSKYETGKIKPSSDILGRLIDVYDININWLLTGRGNIFSSYFKENDDFYYFSIKENNYILSKNDLPYDFSLLKQRVELCHSFALNQKSMEEYNIKNRIMTFKILDDTMDPTLKPGDRVVLEITDSVTTSGIYGIIIDNDLLIARIQKTGNQIKIIYDNSLYKEELFNLEENNTFIRIIGKAILIAKHI